jgi:hypothetical protein
MLYLRLVIRGWSSAQIFILAFFISIANSTSGLYSLIRHVSDRNDVRGAYVITSGYDAIPEAISSILAFILYSSFLLRPYVVRYMAVRRSRGNVVRSRNGVTSPNSALRVRPGVGDARMGQSSVQMESRIAKYIVFMIFVTITWMISSVLFFYCLDIAVWFVFIQ